MRLHWFWLLAVYSTHQLAIALIFISFDFLCGFSFTPSLLGFCRWMFACFRVYASEIGIVIMLVLYLFIQKKIKQAPAEREKSHTAAVHVLNIDHVPTCIMGTNIANNRPMYVLIWAMSRRASYKTIWLPSPIPFHLSRSFSLVWMKSHEFRAEMKSVREVIHIYRISYYYPMQYAIMQLFIQIIHIRGMVDDI